MKYRQERIETFMTNDRPAHTKTARAAKANSVDEPSGEVRSVRRALQLLTLIDASRPRATLSELARESGLATSTVQRLLQTLERERFMHREPDGSYILGPMIVRLGLSAMRAMPLHERAGPWLESLARATRETANLAVLDSPEKAVYLRQKTSPQALRHESWLGRPFDCKHTAVGCALHGEVDNEGGYTTRKTQTQGISAAASPVFGHDTHIIAALSVTAPTSRTSDDALEQLRYATINAAYGLTRALGGEWPYAIPVGERK